MCGDYFYIVFTFEGLVLHCVKSDIDVLREETSNVVKLVFYIGLVHGCMGPSFVITKYCYLYDSDSLVPFYLSLYMKLPVFSLSLSHSFTHLLGI